MSTDAYNVGAVRPGNRGKARQMKNRPEAKFPIDRAWVVARISIAELVKDLRRQRT
jgi:hypothetical protein